MNKLNGKLNNGSGKLNGEVRARFSFFNSAESQKSSGDLNEA